MFSDHPLLFVQGFMEYSYLFYGYYNNTMVEDRNFSYNIPLAYLFTAVFYFAFCLICIIARSVPRQTLSGSVLTINIQPLCMSVKGQVGLTQTNRMTFKSPIHFDLLL